MSEPQESFWESVNRYWFGRGSPTSLGLLRICTGILTFIDLSLLLPDWKAWFSQVGYVPTWIGAMFMNQHIEAWPKSPFTLPRTDIFVAITDPRISFALYVAIMVLALLTALGLWTRVSSLLLAVGMVSLQHRNGAILHGGDTVLRLCVLYVAISPAGRACSIDRLIALWKGRESPNPVLVYIWPQRLVSYNVALIYFTTVWLKTFGHLWRNGTATWYPARLNEFHRFPVPAFFNELPMVYITTYGTLAVEFSLATLVFFRPLRKYCVLGGIMLHASIEYTMNIPLFSYLMVSMYICFFDGEEISAWAERVGRQLKGLHASIFLPQGTRLRPAAAAFLDAVDPLKVVNYLPGHGPTWTAEPNGRAAHISWTRSLGAWVFAWVPGVWPKILDASLEPAKEEPVDPAKQRAKTKKHASR